MNVNLTFIYGSNETNHTRKRSTYMINFFHVINSQHRGKPGKHRGCSWQVVTKNSSLRFVYGTWQRKQNPLLDYLQLFGGSLGELWCPYAKCWLQFGGLPFGFLCLCMLAQSSLFPKGWDARTLCQKALDLWNVSVENEQVKKKKRKKSHLQNKVILSIKITYFLFSLQISNLKWFN